MNLAGQLYKLQQLDTELQKRQQELCEIENQLTNNTALVTAESGIASHKEQLEDAKKKQRSSEWELEDLQEKTRQIEGKLYSGKTKDPKELVNFEREAKALRTQIRTKEDALLGLMSQVEEIEARVKTAAEELERLKQDWQQRQETLGPRKTEVESVLAALADDRHRLVQQIAPDAFNIYEGIRLARGEAVVRVERGRCLGCHIAVPTSQWQKVRAGDLIQCNNCNRILHSE